MKKKGNSGKHWNPKKIKQEKNNKDYTRLPLSPRELEIRNKELKKWGEYVFGASEEDQV